MKSSNVGHIFIMAVFQLWENYTGFFRGILGGGGKANAPPIFFLLKNSILAAELKRGI